MPAFHGDLHNHFLTQRLFPFLYVCKVELVAQRQKALSKELGVPPELGPRNMTSSIPSNSNDNNGQQGLFRKVDAEFHNGPFGRRGQIQHHEECPREKPLNWMFFVFRGGSHRGNVTISQHWSCNASILHFRRRRGGIEQTLFSRCENKRFTLRSKCR